MKKNRTDTLVHAVAPCGPAKWSTPIDVAHRKKALVKVQTSADRYSTVRDTCQETLRARLSQSRSATIPPDGEKRISRTRRTDSCSPSPARTHVLLRRGEQPPSACRRCHGRVARAWPRSRPPPPRPPLHRHLRAAKRTASLCAGLAPFRAC